MSALPQLRRTACSLALRRAWPFAALSPALALAGPSGGVVAAGTAQISAGGTTTTIDQSTLQAIINWQQFSVGAGELVAFNQPDGGMTLNRVVGGLPSSVLGQITASGSVFLVNPQGVLIGAGARIDVGSLVASTLDIADADFLSGNYLFTSAQNPDATVSNAGAIVAADGGFVVLAGDRVESSGLITARFGQVLLASGSELTLTLDQDGLVDFSIDGAALSQAAGVDLSGEILADGGRVILAARAAQNLAQAAVNHSGRIRAATLGESDGEIYLLAQEGDLAITGEAIGAGVQLAADGDIAGAGATLDAGLDFSAIAGGSLLLSAVRAGSGIDLQASGDLTTGALAAPRVAISAPGLVTTGPLEVVSDSGPAGLRIVGGSGIRVGGSITVRGAAGDFTGQGSSSDQVVGASVFFGASSGGIDIAGALTVQGTVGAVLAGGRAFVRGAEVNLIASFGSVTLGGPVAVTGTVGDVEGGELMSAAGAEFNIAAVHGDILIEGPVTVGGSAGDVAGGSSISVAGSQLQLNAGVGSVRIGGDLGISGTFGGIQGGGGFTAGGVVASVDALFGGIDLAGDVSVEGTGGAIEGTSGVFVSGATLRLSSDLDLHLAGDLSLRGTLAAFSASFHGGVVGADLLMSPFAGQLQLDGALLVDGSVGTVTLGDDSFAIGALATAVAFGQGSDEARGSMRFGGPLTVSGSLGPVTAQDFTELSGATLWLDTNFGNLSVDGAVQLDGEIGALSAGRNVNLNGALMLARSAIGSVTVHGIDASGAVLGVDAVAAVNATGADVILQGQFSGTPDGASVRLLGDVRQRGTIGGFVVADTESAAQFNGSVLASAGLSGIRFGNIESDNIFLAFDSDSLVGDASLIGRDYVEIFTASLGPTLSGGRLQIAAPQVFIGANLDLAALEVEAAQGLSVYVALVRAGQVDLHSGGDVSLLALDPSFGPDPDPDLRTEIAGGQVRISGDSVFGDARASIVADGLDIRALDTILLEGAIQVGTGNAGFGGDRALLERLAQIAPDLASASAGPNAYFSAPTVALAQLSLAGDWLQIESSFTALGQAQLASPGTLVHLDPLVDLPFFAESVDVDEAGLTSVQDRIRTDDNQVVPNFGRFGEVRGESALGSRPQLGGSAALNASELAFERGASRNFGELILDSGLAGSTIAIGASDFDAGIQLSDRVVVDVLPSATNFVLLTSSGILGSDRVATNGRVIVLGGRPIVSRGDFYELVASEIQTYYARLEMGEARSDDPEAGNETAQEDESGAQCE